MSGRALIPIASAAAVVAALAVALSMAGTTSAQTQLALTHFDDSGLQVEFAALLEVARETSGPWNLLYQASPRTPAHGTLVDGDLNLGPDDVPIDRIRQAAGTDGDLQINDSDDAFRLGDYFNGDGSDLTIYVQTSATQVASVAVSLQGNFGNTARFNLSSAVQTALQNLSAGDRVIIAMARPAPALAQVTGVAASADDHDSITVEWTAVTDADGYTVEWDTASDFSDPTEAEVSGGSTITYQITGLAEDTQYHVQVRATAAGMDDGPPSDAATATTDYQPPAQATMLRTNATSSSTIDVMWDAAARADGYRVQWRLLNSTDDYDEAASADTSHTITGLDTLTFYEIQVVSTRTNAADGPVSNPSYVATLAAFPSPARVTGVSASADDHDSITVEWSAATDADGYVVEWDTASDFSDPTEAAVSGGSTTTHQITGLAEDTEYHIRVRATRTGALDGDVSDAVSATTTLQPPDMVSGLSASAVSDTGIRLTWAMAPRASGYRVAWGTASGNYTETADTQALTHTISGLTPETDYYFQVTATRANAADGAPSDEADARTHAPPPPGQVMGVSATPVSDREIMVEWQPDPNSTGYTVQWDTDSTFPNPESATVAGTGVIIEDLTSETEYFIRVIGTRLGAVDGTPSAAATATTGQAPVKTWSQRFPGGDVAAQLGLTAFAGVMAARRVRADKSPQRETKIVAAMCLASLILPAFGMGNLFWTGGIVILVALASVAVIFVASRR